MSNHCRWQYDEMHQIGNDYGNVAEVEAYDSRHSELRNVQQENQFILDSLAVRKDQVILDFGAGTGTFAVEAAKRCSKVYAVDVSRVMLEYAKKKADAHGVGNIVFRHGGFLTYDHLDDPVDIIVTGLALHHLPDFWKFIALSRMNNVLKNQGRLFLMDVVFSEENHLENITKWIAGIERSAGPERAEDVRMHVKKEYSTFTWIMEGLLTRTGFRIDQADYQGGVIARYLCTKIDDSHRKGRQGEGKTRGRFFCLREIPGGDGRRKTGGRFLRKTGGRFLCLPHTRDHPPVSSLSCRAIFPIFLLYRGRFNVFPRTIFGQQTSN